MLQFAWIILLFPLLGLLINLLFGKRLGKSFIALVASAAVFASLLTAVGMAAALLALPEADRSVTVQLWQWIHIGDFQVNFALLIDPLSVLMALVVTGVGFFIHWYAATYMLVDDRHQDLSLRLYGRFFIYLNFFILMMLTLVLANNYLQLYVGWEGVGLASYLLIGFWFYKPSAANAGKKAFIVNRIGDFGLALAIMWMFFLFGKQAGSLAFNDIFAALKGAPDTTIAAMTGVTLLLLLAATGKSAQIPLFVWLPDAMEGPTPVSALIHAATMVTAGVYMIARSHPMFELAPTTMAIVAWIGALTALMAASIAIVQTDLKRILAYSTISQLGYMFLGVGVGAYTAGIFHLMTHAFFKALLFLTAGSVMHAMHGELNIDLMGGLRKKMPKTYWQFLAGAAALAGFPLLAGFWSKDAILYEAFLKSPLLWGVGIFTALLTAFYSFRAVYRAFHGEPRSEHAEHAHEQPGGMTAPLWFLTAGALFAGFLGLPLMFGEHANVLGNWLGPVFADLAEGQHGGESLELTLFLVSSAIALLGIFIAYARYIPEWGWAKSLQNIFSPLQNVLENKYWVDEFYMSFIVDPLRRVGQWFYRVSDGKVIEGAVNGIGKYTVAAGAYVARLQTGLLSMYALSFFVGVALILLYFLLA